MVVIVARRLLDEHIIYGNILTAYPRAGASADICDMVVKISKMGFGSKIAG